jgi:hypothetical protein
MTAKLRSRRSGWVSAVILGVVWALAAGVAYAYFTGGSATSAGAGHIAMTVNGTVGAATGAPDLYPGGTGAAYFTLTNSYDGPMSFNKITAASVHSNTGTCADANISIAPSLPYTLATPVTVGAKATSGTQSAPALVRLASDAPNGCEGASFTVALTLSGTFG